MDKAQVDPVILAQELARELGYTWGSSGFRQQEFIEHVRVALIKASFKEQGQEGGL